MTDQNKSYLAFVSMTVEQAIYVLRNIINDEIEQGYETTDDLVCIEELRDLRRKLKHEILWKLHQMQ